MSDQLPAEKGLGKLLTELIGFAWPPYLAGHHRALWCPANFRTIVIDIDRLCLFGGSLDVHSGSSLGHWVYEIVTTITFSVLWMNKPMNCVYHYIRTPWCPFPLILNRFPTKPHVFFMIFLCGQITPLWEQPWPSRGPSHPKSSQVTFSAFSPLIFLLAPTIFCAKCWGSHWTAIGSARKGTKKVHGQQYLGRQR